MKFNFQIMRFSDNEKSKFLCYYCNNVDFPIYSSISTLLLPDQKTKSGDILTN